MVRRHAVIKYWMKRWPVIVQPCGELQKASWKLRIQCRMQMFEKMSQSALNRVLTLPDYRTQQMLQIPLKIFELQNNFNMLVAKQWKIRISVPMSYMRLFENLAVLEKLYQKDPKGNLNGTEIGPYRNLKRSLQRSFEMQIWKAIFIGKFAGGIRCSWGSLCGLFDKGHPEKDWGNHRGRGTQRRL